MTFSLRKKGRWMANQDVGLSTVVVLALWGLLLRGLEGWKAGLKMG